MQLEGIVKALGRGGTGYGAAKVMKGNDASVTKLSDWISPSLAVEVATKRIKAEDKQHLVRTRAHALARVFYELRTYSHAQPRTITCDDANCPLSLSRHCLLLTQAVFCGHLLAGSHQMHSQKLI